MKKSKLILVILLLLICSTGCTNSQQLSASTTSANQDEFLQAMATGISARLADSKDDSDMTDEQKAEYFSKLVDYELSKISKYENATFTDETLNDLAHEYINACNQQNIIRTLSYITLYGLTLGIFVLLLFPIYIRTTNCLSRVSRPQNTTQQEAYLIP